MLSNSPQRMLHLPELEGLEAHAQSVVRPSYEVFDVELNSQPATSDLPCCSVCKLRRQSSCKRLCRACLANRNQSGS